MRVVRAIGALVALAVLLVGVPWALALFGNVPELLTLDWASALGGVQGGRLMLGLLSAAGWVAWLVLTATTVLEVVAFASRYRVSVTLPGTGWLRPVVSTLLLAAVGAPGAVFAHAAQPADADAVPASQGPVGVASVAPATVIPAAPAMEVADASVAAMTRSAPGTATRAYVVQAGDELWALAERELGSGDRWRRIVALNPELGDSGKLTPGTVVQLPATKGAPAAPSPSGEAEVRVIVGDGESLWLIAERELGDAERWPEIFALNRDQIADPNQIDIGWVLRLPGPPQAVDTREKPSTERAVDRPAERAPTETDEAPPAAHEADMPPASTSPEPTPSAMVPIAVPEQPTRSPASPATEATAPPVASVGAEADPMVLAAPLGAALAGAILLSVSTRRRAQLLGRAIGRRLIPASPQVTRFWTALARYAEEPDHANGQDDVGPTALVLGWRGDEPVTVDLEAARATLLSGSRAEEAVAAALTSLACAPWSADVGVIVVGAPEWVDALDDPRFDSEPDVASGLVRLSRFAAERRLALRARDLVSARADVETAEAWRPTVFVFAQTLSPSQLDALADALAMGETGVSVLTLAGAAAHIDARRARIEDETAYLDDTQFEPQLLSSPAKHALLALFATTGRTETEPAPWWRHDENLPPNIHHLSPADARHGEEPATAARLSTPEHPTLLLLGPVGLSGTSGRPPSRAVGQCVEYCAWLLANPGATSTTMLRDLIVAEGTRRSNMSRLRGWLGRDEAGQPYLPDAYTGRITLDSRVTSDWEQLQLLLSGGVNLAPDASLRRALALVRGEPLGDVAFQWHWAEQLRADMVSTIVDAVCVLADRAIARSDHVVALWSIGRGLVAAPGDDQLLVRRIDALMVAGRTDEAHQLVVSLNRGLRDAGRDLAPELARRLHLALGAMNAGGGLAEPTQNLG